MLKTTFREIWKQYPFAEGCRKLVNNLLGYDFPVGSWQVECQISEEDRDKEVSILEILNTVGLKDTLWLLRTQKYEDVCLILADIAESVLWIWEKRYPEDKRPRECIEGIRKWEKGEITFGQLQELRDAVLDAVLTNADIDDAALIADRAANSVTEAAAGAAIYAASFAVQAVADEWDTDAAAKIKRGVQWQENEEILRNHLTKEE